MLNSQCVFAQKNHLKTFFAWAFYIYGFCMLQNCNSNTNTLFTVPSVFAKIPMKFWFLMLKSQPMSTVQSVLTRRNSPKQCFLDVPKLRCPRVWVSFEDRHRSASWITNVCDELICRISCGTLRFGCWVLPFEEQALNPLTLSLHSRKPDT